MGVRGLAKFLNNLGAFKKLFLSNRLRQEEKKVIIIDGDGCEFEIVMPFDSHTRLVYYLWLQQLAVDSLHGGSFTQYGTQSFFRRSLTG
jgi:hypothetical protein